MRVLRTSLTARLIIYFLSLSAVIITLIVAVSFANVRNTLTRSIYQQMDAVSTLKEDELNRWIQDKTEEIVFFSQRAELAWNLLTLDAYDEDTTLYRSAYNNLTAILRNEGGSLASFQEIFLLSPVGGKILVSTVPANEGQYRVSDSYYTQGRLGLYIQNVYTSPQTSKPTMTIATPIFDARGELAGVLAAHLDLERLDRIILQRAGLGETGETYLVDRFSNFISAARFGEREFPRGVHTEGIDAAVQGMDGSGLYTNYDGTPVIGVYKWLEKWDMAIITEVSQEEAFTPARQLGFVVLTIGLITAIVLTLGTYLVARQIAQPILAIRDTALQITSGNIDVSAPVKTQDEIGILAESFNLMTGQLRDTLGDLEMRVAERTADLETARLLSERRATQLLAVGEISKIINSEQKLDILLPLITRLVSERFGNYHTGIFLVDESKTFAVLQAANSQGGRNMLQRGHKLEIGESGIVGYVTKFGEPRIALDVGQDAVYFDNPDLPNTRSEMALPLKFRGEIIGALDVQSDKPGAFTEEDASILSILADQIAIAIENARLFQQTQQSLEELQTLYGGRVQAGWLSFSQSESLAGYHQAIGGGKALKNPVNTDEIQQSMNRGETLVFSADGGTHEPTIVIPIKLRGQVIGAMSIKAPTQDRLWTATEINFAEAISERLSLALENARLLQESRLRAAKEQTISEITGKIGTSIDLRNVLQTAVEELGRSLPGSEVLIQLQETNGDKGKEQA